MDPKVFRLDDTAPKINGYAMPFHPVLYLARRIRYLLSDGLETDSQLMHLCLNTPGFYPLFAIQRKTGVDYQTRLNALANDYASSACPVANDLLKVWAIIKININEKYQNNLQRDQYKKRIYLMNAKQESIDMVLNVAKEIVKTLGLPINFKEIKLEHDYPKGLFKDYDHASKSPSYVINNGKTIVLFDRYSSTVSFNAAVAMAVFDLYSYLLFENDAFRKQKEVSSNYLKQYEDFYGFSTALYKCYEAIIEAEDY